RTRRSRNLAADPHCTFAISLPDLDLVLEGTAARVIKARTLTRVADGFTERGWPLEVEGDTVTAYLWAPRRRRRRGPSKRSGPPPRSVSPPLRRAEQHVGASVPQPPTISAPEAHLASPPVSRDAWAPSALTLERPRGSRSLTS